MLNRREFLVANTALALLPVEAAEPTAKEPIMPVDKNPSWEIGRRWVAESYRQFNGTIVTLSAWQYVMLVPNGGIVDYRGRSISGDENRMLLFTGGGINIPTEYKVGVPIKTTVMDKRWTIPRRKVTADTRQERLSEHLDKTMLLPYHFESQYAPDGKRAVPNEPKARTKESWPVLFFVKVDFGCYGAIELLTCRTQYIIWMEPETDYFDIMHTLKKAAERDLDDAMKASQYPAASLWLVSIEDYVRLTA